MKELCRLLGVSKQAYYQYDEDAALAKLAREEFALQYIRDIRQIAPGMGGSKLWRMYLKEFSTDRPLGRDCFLRLLAQNGLKVSQRLRKPLTTDSRHGMPVYPNLVKDFIPNSGNQLWVSDITYIPIKLDEYRYYFCYLSLVLDAYTEEIVGWSVGGTLDKEYPIRALKKALSRIQERQVELIHHSDRGCQYASREYINLLLSHGIRVSMTDSGDPKDNAQAERINNTIKNELLKGKEFDSLESVIASVAIAIDFYNNRRPHMSIGMRTPVQMREVFGDRDMRWRSLRQEIIKNKTKGENTEKYLPLCNCSAIK